MRTGYVAVTDKGWYDVLARGGGDEVNFWRPSTKAFKSLQPGSPFFFKLKKPHNAICGFGWFAGFTVLPDWMAWEFFGRANGVESLPALRERLAGLRRGARIAPDAEGRIGCVLVNHPKFFPRDRWVPQPTCWKRNTVVGSTYDLEAGEGLRVFEACLSTAHMQFHEERERYREGVERRRLGQGTFRSLVLDAYGRACAVTSEHSLPVLDAAHPAFRCWRRPRSSQRPVATH